MYSYNDKIGYGFHGDFCPVIQSEIQTQDAAQGPVIYKDIFSNDIVKQKQVTVLYMKCIDIRENIINSKPVATRAGPMH